MEGSCIARNEARELSGFGGNFYELPTHSAELNGPVF